MRLFIYIIIFFTFFDLFAQLPIISTFAVSLGAPPFLAGLSVGMYSLANIFGNIASGIISDRKGPFAILVFGLLATGVILASYTFSTGPYSLLTIRFFHGLAAGLSVPAAFTYLANRTDRNRRGKNAAVSGAFVGLAAIIGPAYGAIYASRSSVPQVMGTTGLLLFGLGVLAFFALKRKSIKKETLASDRPAFPGTFLNRGLFLSFTGAFFLMFSQGVLAYMLPLKVVGLGLGSEMSGLLLSTFGISAIFIFLLPVNRLFDKISPLYTLVAGFLLMSLSLFTLSAATSPFVMYSTMSTYGIGFAFLFPSINSLLIDATIPESRGRAYGAFYAFFSFGVVAGSSFTGALGLSADEGFLTTGTLLCIIAIAIGFFGERNGQKKRMV